MKINLIVLILLYLLNIQAYGQDSLLASPHTVNKARLKAAIVTEASLYLGSMAYLQYVWYKDKKRVPFHFYNDSKGYQQVDKMGHSYGSYMESYLCYKWLRSAGVNKKKALIYGGTMGVILQTPIEIFDGLYEDWGFSWSDMAANSMGSMLVISQELLFDEQLFKYKFSFSRSEYAPLSNGYLGDNYFQSLFLDYNGHTYWLSTNVNNFVWKDKIPDWINIAVGYSANGMYGEFQNKTYYHGVALPETTRYRQFLISPDIDWVKISTQSKFMKGLFLVMNFIKIPAPAIEIDGLGRLKGHWIYF